MIHYRSVLCFLTLAICVPTFVHGQEVVGNEVARDPDGAQLGMAVEPPFSPAEASDEVRRVAELAVRVFFPSGIPADEYALREAEDLRLRFAHALNFALGVEYFGAPDRDAEVVEIFYQGRGVVTEDAVDVDVEEGDEGAPLVSIHVPSRYRDGANWYSGFSGETQNQFEVRFPERLARLVGDASRRNGLLSGTPGGEDEPEYLQKEGSLSPLQFLVPSANAAIVGDTDDRVLKGQLDTPQTSRNLMKIVAIGGGCTGALFGRHHVITAAHCIVQRKDEEKEKEFGWTPSVHRVGRNGTEWHAEADARTGWRWYWASSLYLAAAKAGSSPKEYDIAMVIFPDRHIGQQTGWFGLWYSQTEHNDMLNRGYPTCNTLTSPEHCGGHMYGDKNECATRDFSDEKDPMGFSLVGYHSCDTGKGHSGSPLYRRQGNVWTIRGVHKGALRNGWNSFALVTSGRADMAAVFKLAYP